MATESQPAADAPKPKASGLIRWKLLIVLVVLFLGFAFLGAGPVVKWAVQKYGSQSTGTEIKVDSASVNVFTLSVKLDGFRQVDPVDGSKNQFEASELRAKVALLDSLKGQLVIDELGVTNPKGRLTRNTDGTINGTPTEEKKPGESEAEWKRRMEEYAKKRDWVSDAKKLFEKMKERHDAQVAERKKQEEERQKQAGAGGKPMTPEEQKQARAADLKLHKPLVVVRHLVADGVEIAIEDKAAGAPAQSITEAHIEMNELSSWPSHHDKPITMNLSGKMGGAPGSEVKLDGKIDVTGEDTATSVKAHLANLPLAALDAFYKDALPVAFQGKSLGTLDLPLDFKGWDIDWKPAILLDQIDAKARDPNYKILGQFSSSQVAQELTNAAKLPIENVHIHGPIWAPTIDGLDGTLKELIIQGGTALAKKKALEKGQELLDKNPQAKQAADKAKEALDKTGLGGAVDGLFGGKKDEPAKDDKQTDKKQPPKPNAPPPDKSAADKAGDAIKGVGGSLFGGDKK